MDRSIYILCWYLTFLTSMVKSRAVETILDEIDPSPKRISGFGIPPAAKGLLKSESDQQRTNEKVEVKLTATNAVLGIAKKDEEAVKKSSRDTFNVFLIYSLVLLTIVIKTAPNVVYHFVYKTEKAGEKGKVKVKLVNEGRKRDEKILDYKIEYKDFWWPQIGLSDLSV